MAFQITPLQIRSLTPDYSAENGAFARLGESLGNLPGEMRKQALEAQKQQTLQSLGQDVQSGNLRGAAAKAIALGEIQGGASLLAQGQKADALGQGNRLINSWDAGGNSAPAPAYQGGYFNQTRAAESGNNDSARNPSSTATGRYQFLQGTWNGLMQSNPELGLTADGRSDPAQQERAMRAFTAQNADALRAKGVDPTDRNLYMAHFLGAGAAPNFIQAVQQDPSVPASSLVRPEVVAANRSVFLNGDGSSRSAGEVYQRMTGRFGDGSTAVAALGGGHAPVQVAQAGGGPRPDVPAPNAAEAQGYFIPPGQGAQTTVENDKQVQTWQQRYNQAVTTGDERAIKIAEKNLEQATKAAERRYNEGKAPEAIREWQWARQNGLTEAKNPIAYAKEKAEAGRTSKTAAQEVEERKAAAAAAGMSPSDPRYQTYVMTGKTPREDAQPLTATDKKAILEADEGVEAANSAITALREAKKISPQALGGWGAGKKAAIANNLPDWMVPDIIASPKGAEATVQLDNLVGTNALSQLKAIFGGNPTEGERAIMMELQGSSNLPDPVRQKIYDRAITMAERRLGFQQQRATELRGGTYYKPGTGEPGGQAPRPASERAAAPDVSNAKQASDGNWYVPDPSRPGKYLMVQPQ